MFPFNDVIMNEIETRDNPTVSALVKVELPVLINIHSDFVNKNYHGLNSASRCQTFWVQ